MIITKGSQLGLRFEDSNVKVEFLKIIRSYVNGRLSSLNEELSFIQKQEQLIKETKSNASIGDYYQEYVSQYELSSSIDFIGDTTIMDRVSTRVTEATGTEFMETIISDDASKYFFICESVYRAAETIKINENFTSRTLKDIKPGHYTYLMGKNKMVRFVVVPKAIKGFYYNDFEQKAFEFGCDIETGDFYATKENNKEFSMIMQVLTFVELGDIELVELEGGRNNGKSKKDGKITNTNNFTVYVVDSSWNKLIIRTDGFAVKGHHRLQPCGEGHADRILIWINAFEKHGYVRRPKAEIIR